MLAFLTNISFFSTLLGRYCLLFMLVVVLGFYLYVKEKHDILKSIQVKEMNNALVQENLSLRAGESLVSQPGWVFSSDKYERKSN